MSESESVPARCPYRVLPCSGRALVVATLCAGLFVFLAWRPLWHTDLWGHLAYGRAIIERGGLPDSEPYLMLASEGKIIDTAWLSQVIGYEVFQVLGVGGIQWLYGASIAFCALLLLRGLIAGTESVLWSVAGCALFLYVDWQQLLIVRPQLAGLICFVALFLRLDGPPRRTDWLFVPALFAVWANLHGSFVMGWGLIAAHGLGALIDGWFRADETHDDQETRSGPAWLLMVVLAIAATFLNPGGADLHREIWSIARNPNLADLIEWQPLLTHARQRLAFFVAVVVLVAAGWRSTRRKSSAEVILLVSLGIATLWTSRMILWWAPIAGWFVAMQGSSIRQPDWEQPLLVKLNARTWPRTAAALAVLIVAVGSTPEGMALLTARPLAFERCVSDQTPVGAAAYLAEVRPEGLIFNTYEWGDYLIWAVPGPIKVFVHSHAHLVPPPVWQDYLQVSRGRPGWEGTLDKYGVNVVVIDPHLQTALAEGLHAHTGWKVAFEDDRSIIFERKSERGTNR